MAVVFLKIGQDVHISGGLLCDATKALGEDIKTVILENQLLLTL